MSKREIHLVIPINPQRDPWVAHSDLVGLPGTYVVVHREAGGHDIYIHIEQESTPTARDVAEAAVRVTDDAGWASLPAESLRPDEVARLRNDLDRYSSHASEVVQLERSRREAAEAEVARLTEENGRHKAVMEERFAEHKAQMTSWEHSFRDYQAEVARLTEALSWMSGHDQELDAEMVADALRALLAPTTEDQP